MFQLLQLFQVFFFIVEVDFIVVQMFVFRCVNSVTLSITSRLGLKYPIIVFVVTVIRIPAH